MSKLVRTLARYYYQLPPELIAQEPASLRDSARLLVYNRHAGETFFDTFRNLIKYLPPKSVLVFNQTKVIPARFTVQKETGGKAVLLYIRTEGKNIIAMCDRPIRVGSKLKLGGKEQFIVEAQEKYVTLKPLFPIRNWYGMLERYGKTPLPPYIKHSPLTEAKLKEKYQTVFARERGSVAAPTASLHFTRALLQRIKKAGHEVTFVTLHVNLGTFAPVKEEQLASGKLHEEYFEIPKKTAALINHAKKQGRPIIAVGTTVTRTLESAYVLPLSKGEREGVLAGSGTTDLFIRGGYQFQIIDSMITNFHVPESSLLMLVSALVGRKKLFALYQQAIEKQFRFFSFGDGMLII
ncbi:tRNA preQ1(34) S-adenosylmethionine ribosyltransferase-isomerase QueA [Candidatus Uhrbacteria bacterium RIFCSPLOWO2_02_FULL_51_9]|uniref:S-adenosylmethionine:tRNA ribosyltransferase-isomerase n=1 Tax=Candidatus Uhrbacteria bacterium RIFCSPLOWO2_02_FULL_51_9 TaxID=1802410 RepID=A0A1F7VEX3_9BACT|nr:MAG: tRNA preQ1(34) S-adenosylmethionine ribosyltransferase-isomerase QueA [Candidatus Uhrbacteria bacterium RIFCSPLOWO2_02_FULL_51_9]